MTKITQGQIWIVKTDNFLTSGRSNKFNRPIKVKENELIEIRYPFAWHFRTIDSNYWHAEAEDIYKNCELFGIIWPDVKSGNNCNLSQIINLSLYENEGINSYNWAKNFTVDELKSWGLDKLVAHAKDKQSR